MQLPLRILRSASSEAKASCNDYHDIENAAFYIAAEICVTSIKGPDEWIRKMNILRNLNRVSIVLCVYNSKTSKTENMNGERENYTLQTGAMSESSSPTDFVDERL